MGMIMKIPSFVLVTLCVATIAITACSGEETANPSENPPGFRHTALEFARSLVARDYEEAYAMMSHQCRNQTTVERLRADFEAIVPPDWGPMAPVEVGETMTNWPGKHPSDLGWAYVSIGGDVYSEAVTIIVTSEQREAKIRDVEFGRP